MSKTANWLESYKKGMMLSSKETIHDSQYAYTLSITSGKGGVGKTSLAIKVGLELAKLNYKVLLIDGDYNLSNTLIKLNLPLNNKFFDFVQDENNFKDCLYKIGNFHLLPGCNGHPDLFENNIHFDKLVINLINKFEKVYDFILIDSPAGVSRNVLNINAYTYQRIVVVTPDKSSITDSYSLIKLLKMRYGIRENFFVVNRFENEEQLDRVQKTLEETAKHFLGVKLTSLGGIKECVDRIDNFDRLLVDDEKSLIHKNILKIVYHLIDRHRPTNYEQDVNLNKLQEKKPKDVSKALNGFEGGGQDVFNF